MLQPYIEWTPTTTTYMLTHIFIPPFSVQASCLHASADFIHHLVVLLVAATVGRSRSWRSARLTGAGSGWGWRGWRGWRTSSRSGTTTTCGSSSDSSGGGTATWGAGTRADILTQNVLTRNGNNTALGLLASGSAAADEIASVGRSGGS